MVGSGPRLGLSDLGVKQVQGRAAGVHLKGITMNIEYSIIRTHEHNHKPERSSGQLIAENNKAKQSMYSSTMQGCVQRRLGGVGSLGSAFEGA